MPSPRPQLYVIAGSNGSGKTTFAKRFLPAVVSCKEFINVDSIAQGLSPLSPSTHVIEAGRIFLQKIEAYAEQKASFAFETTLSGKSYIH